MCDRLPLAEVRFLAIVIGIQQQAGGNLSEALSNLAGVLRERQMLALKVKALSAEAKASALVLASLPPGVMTMVYLSSPDYIDASFYHDHWTLHGCRWGSVDDDGRPDHEKDDQFQVLGLFHARQTMATAKL